MKLRFLTVILAALAAVAFTSCNKDENNGGGGKTTSYSVVFDAKGGKIDGKETVVSIVTAGARVTKPNDPVLEGNSFLGWFVNDTTQWDFNEAVNQDMTLKAHWKPEGQTVTVVFDANGGKFEGEKDTLVRTVASGAKVKKPDDPVLEGNIFLGWFLKDGTKWNFNNAVTADMELYADWQEIPSVETTRYMVIRFSNGKDYVFQYRFSSNLDGSLQLDTVKVGSEAYPLTYVEDTVLLWHSSEPFGKMVLNGDGYADSLVLSDGGKYTMRYQNGLMDSLAYTNNGDTTVLEKNAELGTDLYGRFDTEITSPLSIFSVGQWISYPENLNSTRVFTPGFFNYAVIENIWNDTPQVGDESLIAMAVFNTPFFGKAGKYIPMTVYVEQGSKCAELDINYEYAEDTGKGAYWSAIDTRLDGASYSVMFYDIWYSGK